MQKKQIAYLLIAIGVLIAVGLLVVYLIKTTELNVRASIDTNIFASYGSLIGGVLGALFSLAGIFLLIATLESQEKAIANQKGHSEIQFFENKFFELIKMHRENSNEIEVKKRRGRKVFLVLQREFYHCKLVIDALNEMTSKKLKEEEVINISYLCFFFGAVGETSTQILKEKLAAYSDYYESIKKMFKESQDGFDRKGDLPYKPFEGHQSRLGHYFRHLFQVVKFVDQQPTTSLPYRKKYEYIRILRAQLSTQEQAFLFYNSISDLGRPWERQQSNENAKLITKYNLIKNIPVGYTQGFDVRKYYPNLKFEGDQLTEQRKTLEAFYA